MGRDKVGGVKLGRRKLKVLGYADDLVILAEEEEGTHTLLLTISMVDEKIGEVFV